MASLLNCPPSTTAYRCGGLAPDGSTYNFCSGTYVYVASCNSVGITRSNTTALINDDYSVTFSTPYPALTTVYAPGWYTCEGWLNPAYASDIPAPLMSKVIITITNNSTGTSTTTTLTDPVDLSTPGTPWTYTTPGCVFAVDGQYSIALYFEFDQSSSIHTVNNLPWCSGYGMQLNYSGRPGIGYELNFEGQVVSGSLLPYDPAANCGLVAASPTVNERPRRNRIR